MTELASFRMMVEMPLLKICNELLGVALGDFN
jgi:hypothetical protein